MNDVSIVACASYEEEQVRTALLEALEAIGGLDWVKEGMRIVIKANLVSFMKPESAATTHPVMLSQLTKILKEKGAEVILGDSPGGLYSAAYVGRVYKAAGMHEVEKAGALLNDDYSTAEGKYPEGKVLHSLTYTGYLDKADAIINFCKLKTHGMMGMSAAVKNMFGTIPGIVKPEYHYRFPSHEDFAHMLVDLNEYFKPRLCLCDAVEGMEGNGPTMGKPRHVGALLASNSPYALDLVAADLMGLDKENIPTLMAAFERGLAPDSVDKLTVYGDYASFRVKNFKNIATKGSIEFSKDSQRFFGRAVRMFTAGALRSVPKLQKKTCVGCGVCAGICPAKALKIEKGKAVIDRSLCIRCFCCQEFCPKGAMRVKRPLIAKMLTK